MEEKNAPLRMKDVGLTWWGLTKEHATAARGGRGFRKGGMARMHNVFFGKKNKQ